MKANIRGIECEGTPEELAAFEREHLAQLQPVAESRIPWRPPVIGPWVAPYPYRAPYRLGRVEESILKNLNMVCDHDFPAVWHGIIPPTCSKCEMQAGGTVTYGVQS